MTKTALAVALSTVLSSVYVTDIYAEKLVNQPINRIKSFVINDHTSNQKKYSFAQSSLPENGLLKIKQTTLNGSTYKRYQQTYKGIPVIGRQVVITEASKAPHSLQSSTSGSQTTVSGDIEQELSMNTQTKLNEQQAIEAALQQYQASKNAALSKTTRQQAQLQIRFVENKPTMVYLISFFIKSATKTPSWPHFVIDANSGKIIKQWDNIQHEKYIDSGPGGNDKIGRYWYGQDSLINYGLEVTKNGATCTMDNGHVRLINLKQQWDWEDTIQSPSQAYSYPCGNNQGDPINGGFSPSNDAYYMGGVIINMYQNWYHIPALSDRDGNSAPLVMRVHFGQAYDNAFWDGETMNFGDGDEFYPLVSPDVAGHEVSHGFTEQHSGLEYHDQMGAINESFSDMAGQAVRAYLLSQQPDLYNKLYAGDKEVTWDIGKTIFKGQMNQALRYMDMPSKDEVSADCGKKAAATSAGGQCKISYKDVVNKAKQYYPLDVDDQQSFIVHTASGVFNRAFYLMSEKIGIQKAFETMLLANIKYWQTTSDYQDAACGVVNAANDLHVDAEIVKNAFTQVGVKTC